MNLIEARDLWKTYVMGSEEVHALAGVDVTVAKGDYVAIMGPSGSGKSTLMNLLRCLDNPSKGSYRLNGREVSSMTDDELSAIRNQEIGFVFQTFHFLLALQSGNRLCVPDVSLASHAPRRSGTSSCLSFIGGFRPTSAAVERNARLSASILEIASIIAQASFPADNANGSRSRGRS